MAAANDLCWRFSHPIRLGLAVGARLPAVAPAVVVSTGLERHPVLAADRQRAVPLVRAILRAKLL